MNCDDDLDLWMHLIQKGYTNAARGFIEDNFGLICAFETYFSDSPDVRTSNDPAARIRKRPKEK